MFDLMTMVWSVFRRKGRTKPICLDRFIMKRPVSADSDESEDRKNEFSEERKSKRFFCLMFYWKEVLFPSHFKGK